MNLGWKGRAGIILYTTLSSLTGLGFREKIIQTPLFSTCKLQKGKPEEKDVPQSSILSRKTINCFKKGNLEWHPELDNKILLLRTPCTWLIDHGEIELVFTWKLHSYWLAFMVLQVPMHSTRGEKVIILTLLWILQTNYNDWPDKICSLRQ